MTWKFWQKKPATRQNIRLAGDKAYLLDGDVNKPVEDAPVVSPEGQGRYSVELWSADGQHYRIVTVVAESAPLARQIAENRELELEAAGYERYYYQDNYPE